MRQYELTLRIAQIYHLVDEKKYRKALAVIQTLDIRQVRSLSDLKLFAEVYTKTEQYEAAKNTYLKIFRHSHTKRILYRLIYLSIRTNDLDDAEAYYQEFLRMNPNKRDAIILRYRIDKAAGESIDTLIDTLKELKQEEYIEEWAYELAKLYHRAGRVEECKAECEDIILWYGTGEIVDRAKILIDHLEEKNEKSYIDEKDFTEPVKETPNPDDTGSLPDLQEYIKERKAMQKKEREEFVDDYDDDEFMQDGLDISQKAKEGIQKISGFLKKSKKENQETEKDRKKEEPKAGYVPNSQSGMGITQNLAKEIAAIYEMEHKEQLKEKAVTVISEGENIVSDAIEKMNRAIEKTANKSYIPLDIEEINNSDADTGEIPEVDATDEDKTDEEVLKSLLDEDIENSLNDEVEEPEKVVEVEEAVEESEKEVEAEETVEEPEKVVEVEEAVEEPEKVVEAEETVEEPEEVVKEPEESETVATEQNEKMEFKTVVPVSSELENYEAPDIPVVETEYMEMPEVNYDDLPTTRALHNSFENVLQLIGGELDPSHFVLLGEGSERIVGVSKRIVKVMKKTGYLSVGRIAKINAKQLNNMDVISFRRELKGNCLLIENASELLFPIISRIFSIMEEYYGDFVVILADEGGTIDQLFRFVPVLAKKFKYIIDISKYDKKDYEV